MAGNRLPSTHSRRNKPITSQDLNLLARLFEALCHLNSDADLSEPVSAALNLFQAWQRICCWTLCPWRSGMFDPRSEFALLLKSRP